MEGFLLLNIPEFAYPAWLWNLFRPRFYILWIRWQFMQFQFRFCPLESKFFSLHRRECFSWLLQAGNSFQQVAGENISLELHAMASSFICKRFVSLFLQ
jgi:hypothetical protein